MALSSARRPNDIPHAGQRPAWRRPLLLAVVLFAATFAVANSCQKDQIRITKEFAVAKATQAIDFKPERTQVRLVRQGLNGRPYWAVSLSIPKAGGHGYTRVATARVDANTGKLVALTDATRQENNSP